MSHRGIVTSSISVSAAEAEYKGNLPRAFGRYTLFDHIGRGGMADIYLATRRDSLGGSRHVVIKQILPELSADPEFAGMLTAEAKLAANLNHANVVQVMDLGREAGRLFIAMEYVEGYDLNQLLRRLSKARVPLAAEFALFVVRETLRALDYAHRARNQEGRPLQLVHRDVSPSNVLISLEGEVKLCDFGIARAGHAAGDPQQEDAIASSRVAGKSAYMAPEQASGEEIDAGADIFSAGILLWELVSGHRLYKGTEEEMLAMAQRGEVPPVRDGRMPSQEQLQRVLDRALARERGARYATAAEFLHELEDYALEAGLMASQLRFASFLTDQFATDILDGRRARERMVTAHEEEGQVQGSAVRAIAERSAGGDTPASSPATQDNTQDAEPPAISRPASSAATKDAELIAPETTAEAISEPTRVPSYDTPDAATYDESEDASYDASEAVVGGSDVAALPVIPQKRPAPGLAPRTGFLLGIGIGLVLIAVAVAVLKLF